MGSASVEDVRHDGVRGSERCCCLDSDLPNVQGHRDGHRAVVRGRSVGHARVDDSAIGGVCVSRVTDGDVATTARLVRPADLEVPTEPSPAEPNRAVVLHGQKALDILGVLAQSGCSDQGDVRVGQVDDQGLADSGCCSHEVLP